MRRTYSILAIENVMIFELKGLTGDETAKITIPGKETKDLGIGKYWQTYSFPVPDQRSFVLKIIANLMLEKVDLQPAFKYEIRYEKNWGKWHCGTENEDKRCGQVRRGLFAWTGSYKLFHKNQGMVWLSKISRTRMKGIHCQ